MSKAQSGPKMAEAVSWAQLGTRSQAVASVRGAEGCEMPNARFHLRTKVAREFLLNTEPEEELGCFLQVSCSFLRRTFSTTRQTTPSFSWCAP